MRAPRSPPRIPRCSKSTKQPSFPRASRPLSLSLLAPDCAPGHAPRRSSNAAGALVIVYQLRLGLCTRRHGPRRRDPASPGLFILAAAPPTCQAAMGTAQRRLLLLAVVAIGAALLPCADSLKVVNQTTLYASIIFTERLPKICNNTQDPGRPDRQNVVRAFLNDTAPQIFAILTRNSLPADMNTVGAYDTCRTGVNRTSSGADTVSQLRINVTYTGKATTRVTVVRDLNNFTRTGTGPCRKGGLDRTCSLLALMAAGVTGDTGVERVLNDEVDALDEPPGGDRPNVTVKSATFRLKEFPPETCDVAKRPRTPQYSDGPKWQCEKMDNETFFLDDFCAVDCKEPRATGAGFVVECQTGNEWAITGGCTATPRCSQQPGIPKGTTGWDDNPRECTNVLVGSVCRTNCTNNSLRKIVVQCVDEDTWSQPAGDCTADRLARCPSEPPTSNDVGEGIVGWQSESGGPCSNTREGRLCTADCKDGWYGVGYSSLCIDGKWNQVVGGCEKGVCLTGPTTGKLVDTFGPAAGSWDKACSNVTVGFNCSAPCKRGFKGPGYQSTCIDSNTWSTPEAPRGNCVPDTCDGVPELPIGASGFNEQTCKSGAVVDTVCRSPCAQGYRGSATAQCLSGGKWDVTNQCRPIRCGSTLRPDMVPASTGWNPSCTGAALYGSTCTAECASDAYGVGYTATCNDINRTSPVGEWKVNGSCLCLSRRVGPSCEYTRLADLYDFAADSEQRGLDGRDGWNANNGTAADCAASCSASSGSCVGFSFWNDTLGGQGSNCVLYLGSARVVPIPAAEQNETYILTSATRCKEPPRVTSSTGGTINAAACANVTNGGTCNLKCNAGRNKTSDFTCVWGSWSNATCTVNNQQDGDSNTASEYCSYRGFLIPNSEDCACFPGYAGAGCEFTRAAWPQIAKSLDGEERNCTNCRYNTAEGAATFTITECAMAAGGADPVFTANGQELFCNGFRASTTPPFGPICTLLYGRVGKVSYDAAVDPPFLRNLEHYYA